MQIRFKWYETDTGRSVQWFPVNIAVDHIDTVVLYGFDTRHWNKKKEPSRPLTTREPIFENKQTNKQNKTKQTNQQTLTRAGTENERGRYYYIYLYIYIFFCETKRKKNSVMSWFEYGSRLNGAAPVCVLDGRWRHLGRGRRRRGNALFSKKKKKTR